MIFTQLFNGNDPLNNDTFLFRAALHQNSTLFASLSP